MSIKQEIKEKLDLLEEINNRQNKNEYMLEIQKNFINCFKYNIKKAEEKKEIMELLYILRYYKFIPYNNEKFIKDVDELYDDISLLEKLIIEKLVLFKLLNKTIKNAELNAKIIKLILNTRIMKFEDAYVEFEKGEENILINIYDGDTFEKNFKIEKQEKIQIKYNKKIKIFN